MSGAPEVELQYSPVGNARGEAVVVDLTAHTFKPVSRIWYVVAGIALALFAALCTLYALSTMPTCTPQLCPTVQISNQITFAGALTAAKEDQLLREYDKHLKSTFPSVQVCSPHGAHWVI